MGDDEGRATARDQLRTRHAAGRAFAPSLVGLGREEAVGRAEERGFEAEVIPHTVDGVSLDLRYNRIRLYLDEADAVVRAEAG